MTTKIVHHSKFRNIFGQSNKKQDCYEGIPGSSNMFENNYSCVNPKFLAVATKATGSFTVVPVKKTGRQSNLINIKHSGSQLMDIKWNPFNDRMLATSSDDGTIKIWLIPEEGLKDNTLAPLRTISHHKKRVYNLEWHPSAENILASASADNTAAVLDIGASSDKDVLVSKTGQHDDFVSQVCWDYEGERLFTFGKEHIIRCFDARTGKLIQKASATAHQQKRAIRLTTLGKSNLIISTGFSGLNSPELKLWEMDNLDNCLMTHPCGEGSGVLFPFFDNDTNVLFVASRGEVTIRYFELSKADGEWKLYDLYIFNSQTSQKSLCFMPKRGLEYMDCEIARAYKVLNSSASIEPVSFFVPRRAEGFQDDLYPDTVGVDPALTAEAWRSGSKSGPLLVPIQDIPKETSRDAPITHQQTGGSDNIDFKEIEETLEAEIASLKEELKSAEEKYDAKNKETKIMEDKIKQLTEKNAELEAQIESLNNSAQQQEEQPQEEQPQEEQPQEEQPQEEQPQEEQPQEEQPQEEQPKESEES